ncbi:MAG: cytochrome C, partial [bacterium]
STQRDCALCHSYPDWTLVNFTHVSSNYPGEHHAALACASCHTSNTDTVPYVSPADAGSCGACHSKDFKADMHPKTANGLRYSASELKNCSGACHVYSDETLSTITKVVPGPYHRVSDDAFKH